MLCNQGKNHYYCWSRQFLIISKLSFMYTKLIAPALFMLFFHSAYAQQGKDSKEESKRLVALSQKLEGTYQVQIINSRELGEIPLQYMDSIVARRSPNQTIYIPYPNKNSIRIMVPSQSDIDKPGFVKLKKVVHISQ
jgi:hypothetical protein